MTMLFVRDESGFREARAEDVLERAHMLLAQRFRVGTPVLEVPERTRSFLRMHVATLEHEVFGILHLDARHRLIAVEDLFRGTIDAAVVYPREVLRSVVKHNATAVVCFHNHPSGCPEPSRADELVTRRLKEVLALIEVRILDHLVIGESVVSFAERGLL